MIETLIQHGNSVALVVDRAILETLNIDVHTALELTTVGKNLIVSPAVNQDSRERVSKALKKVNERHVKTLRKLAK